MRSSITRRELIQRSLIIAGGSLLVGCGGGGVSGSTDGRTDRVTTGPTGLDQTFGPLRLIIPEGAFPTAASLVLTQQNRPSSLPPNSNFRLAAPGFKLTADQNPARDLTVAIADDHRAYLAGQLISNEWLPLTDRQKDGWVEFTLPAGRSLGPSRSIGSIWQGVIGLVEDHPDTDYSIRYLSGNSNFGAPGTILVVHGLLDNWQAMNLVGERAKVVLGGDGIFSLAFDWREGAEAAGDWLATLLRPFRTSYKQVTIVAYSQGVLVARHCLEQDGETAAVDRCVFLVGPNLGSPIADPADWLFNLGRLWLNGQFACSPKRLDVDDPALRELRPGSSFLSTLNTYRPSQTGQVKYYLFAGGNDWVVSEASALASGIELREMTGGGVWTRTVPEATHFNIKADQNLIDQALASTGLDLDDQLEIFIEPSPIDAQEYGWFYTVRLRNNTNSPITLTDLSLISFDRNGVWLTTEWYDPQTQVGQFFPTRHVYWQASLGAGQTTPPIDVQLWPDWSGHGIDDPNLAANLKAKTVQIAVSATRNGVLMHAQTTVLCHHGDIWPSNAQTRSAYPAEGQHHLTSLAA